jgi:hypothetical protein
MAGIADRAAGKVVGLLTAPAGLNGNLAAIREPGSAGLAPISGNQVTAQNVAIELAERSSEVQYPAVHVYCERVVNGMKEKFRTFSGTVRMAVEVRLSQDRLEGIEGKLQAYVEAATRVLDGSRGDWGEGMFYTGGYEAAFGPVKRGGKGFVQVAKVTFEVEVSRS